MDRLTNYFGFENQTDQKMGRTSEKAQVQGGYQHPTGFVGKTAVSQLQSQFYILPDSFVKLLFHFPHSFDVIYFENSKITFGNGNLQNSTPYSANGECPKNQIRDF